MKVRKLPMPRPAKEYRVINCKIDKDIADMLDKFSSDTGISKTATVEKALKMYIAHFNKTGKI